MRHWSLWGEFKMNHVNNISRPVEMCPGACGSTTSKTSVSWYKSFHTWHFYKMYRNNYVNYVKFPTCQVCQAHDLDHIPGHTINRFEHHFATSVWIFYTTATNFMDSLPQSAVAQQKLVTAMVSPGGGLYYRECLGQSLIYDMNK